MKTAKTLDTEGFFGQLYEFQSILKMSQLHLLIFHPGHQPGKPDGWSKEESEGEEDAFLDAIASPSTYPCQSVGE